MLVSPTLLSSTKELTWRRLACEVVELHWYRVTEEMSYGMNEKVDPEVVRMLKPGADLPPSPSSSRALAFRL